MMINDVPISLKRKLPELSKWLGGRTLTYTAWCSNVSSVHRSKRAGERVIKRERGKWWEKKHMGKMQNIENEVEVRKM